MRSRTLFIWFSMLLCLAQMGLAQEPWCPAPTHQLVNDYSGVLSPSQKQELENRLVAFDDSTSNQVLIVIVPSLHDCEIMELGTRIGSTWGVGQRDSNNGVVILIKSKESKSDYGDVAILPGYGLEGVLPDMLCNRITGDIMAPQLSQGDYYQAISDALDIIEPACRGEFQHKRSSKDSDGRGNFFVLGLVILIIVVAFIVGTRNKKDPPDRDDFFDDRDHRNRRSLWPFIFFPRGGGSGFGGSGGFGGFGGSGGFGGFGGGSFGGGGSHSRF